MKYLWALDRKINEKLYSKESFCSYFKEEYHVKPVIVFNPMGEKGWGTGWIDTYKKKIY